MDTQATLMDQNNARLIEHQLFWPIKNHFSVSSLVLSTDLPEHFQPIRPLFAQLSHLANSIRELQAINERSPHLEKQITQLLHQSGEIIEEISQVLSSNAEKNILRKKAQVLKGELEARPVLEQASQFTEEELILLCGPLSTWHKKTKQYFHSMIAAIPDAELNRTIKQADRLFYEVLLPRFKQDIDPQLGVSSVPSFVVGELVACGGEADRYPKHFSYFLPEDEGVKWAKMKKTIVFSNLYQHRFQHTTLKLGERFFNDFRVDEHYSVTKPLIMWLRGHDIGHSIVLPTTSYKELRQIGRWNSMLVQEAIADTYGFLANQSPEWRKIHQASVEQVTDLFISELIRYLLKGWNLFPDSGAALLELSYLIYHGHLKMDNHLRIHYTDESIVTGMENLTKKLTELILTPKVAELDIFLDELIGNSKFAQQLKHELQRLVQSAEDIPMYETYVGGAL